MSEIIMCNTATLSTDKSSVGSDINKIDTSIANLRNLLAQLDSMWDGDASEVFKYKLNGYLNQLQSVTDSMRSVEQYEDKAVTEYDTCERSISGMISSISV